MKNVTVYVHGKGGSAKEAKYYRKFFNEDCDIIGFDYKSEYPWDAKVEFINYFDSIIPQYNKTILIANSIGAYFSLLSLANKKIEKAMLISPIVNMERLILDMMLLANVSEEELSIKKEIETSFGETLSWEYLSYVRENPISWNIPTEILYGKKDNMTSVSTMTDFSKKINAHITTMSDGEHWFHTREQMCFLDNWIKSNI
jgi:hypothetical protein